MKTDCTNITLIEPSSIRVNFHPEDNTVTIVDVGYEESTSVTLPADYLVKTIAPAVAQAIDAHSAGMDTDHCQPPRHE